MTEPTTPSIPPTEGSNRNLPGLNAYLSQYHGKFTDEVLTATLLKEGYARADIEAGLGQLSGADVSAPVRARARRSVQWAYGITYAVLVVGMFANQPGTVLIGAVVLGISLGLAFALSTWWLGWRGRKVVNLTTATAVLVSVPVILLVIVAGTCVATGLPVPHF
jgi:hypothetical protein